MPSIVFSPNDIVLVCGASHVESPALDKHEAVGRRCRRKSSYRHKANKCASENSGKHYFNFPYSSSLTGSSHSLLPPSPFAGFGNTCSCSSPSFSLMRNAVTPSFSRTISPLLCCLPLRCIMWRNWSKRSFHLGVGVY